MKILLIGKTGQIGREIEKIGEKKHAIKAFSRKDLDILDYNSITKIVENWKPNAIINASGYHVVADCEKFPEEAFKINTFAVRKLAEICLGRNIRVVNFSTDKVFDGKKKTAYSETDLTHPIQVYGMSKLAGEIATHTINTEAITIRTCGVYGGKSGSRVKKGNFVLMILEQSKVLKTLEISSEQIASFVYAEDLARVTLELLEKKAKGGIYHVVNEGYGSWSDFAKAIVKSADLPLKIIPVDRSGVYSSVKIPIFAALNVRKIKDEGIKIDGWKKGLDKYVKFLKKEQVF